MTSTINTISAQQVQEDGSTSTGLSEFEEPQTWYEAFGWPEPGAMRLSIREVGQ